MCFYNDDILKNFKSKNTNYESIFQYRKLHHVKLKNELHHHFNECLRVILTMRYLFLSLYITKKNSKSHYFFYYR